MSLPGRVVRLHFCCRAELPIGSTLRVTGSTLWAPTQLTAEDPSNAHHVSSQFATQGPAVGSLEEVVDPNVLESSGGNTMYASSVELYTTPEEYPIWKTRRPVVIVLHKKSSSQIQHHYYRYMVVTPGAQNTNNVDEFNEQQNNMTAIETKGSTDSCDSVTVRGGATSDGFEGSVPVMMWEDPFPDLGVLQRKEASESSTSLRSVTVLDKARSKSNKTLKNLPYRTLDIEVATASVLGNPTSSNIPDGYSVFDNWNNGDDYTYRSYLIRESINETNWKLNRKASDVTDISDHEMDTEAEENMKMEAPISNTSSTDGLLSEPASGSRTPLSSLQRIFFVCYHLPVVVTKNSDTGQWTAQWAESLLAKTEGSSVTKGYDAHWVGTVTTNPPITSQDDQDAVRALLKPMGCTPLFIDEETRNAAYYGFCKQVLWPAFHNIDMLDLSTSGWILTQPQQGKEQQESADVKSDWDQSRLESWLQAFIAVNQRFARVMTDVLKPNDIFWVHDYHLSLLPKLVNEEEFRLGRCPSKKIFFLHIPFPTSQIFREIEFGETVLEGMLNADVVGFHSFDHARHFLNASKRILGLQYESLVGGLIGVHFQNRTVLITMSNVSIEPIMLDKSLVLPSVDAGANMIREKHTNRTIISGIDITQRLSGVSLKLIAFERLLKDYPSWQNKVVMVQKCMLPGSRKADEANTAKEVRYLVKRIQDTFGPQVIDYEEVYGSSLPVEQRLALWRASDIFMITPIREGLNMLPMEYIYARKEPHTPGVIIASELSAVTSILNGALRINPYDIQMSVATIDKALTMDMEEREARRHRDIDFVSKSPSDRWTRNVLRDLRDSTRGKKGNESESQSAASTPGVYQNNAKQALIDSTAAFLATESAASFTHLDREVVKQAYNSSSRRVIILDFNGTIVPKEPPGKYLKRDILGSSGFKPPAAVIQALANLCSDPANTVYVVSGDVSETVEKALGHIPGLGLAGSNGGHFSPPVVSGQSERKWLSFDLGVDWDAVKRVALPLISKYTARTNGSFVKLTRFSIGWSYYSCDPEWGSLQASHLVLELEKELAAFDVRFVTLKGVVEVVPRKLNKGLIVKKVLRDVNAKHADGMDFVLCMGDDISDEKMFTSVFSFVAEVGDDRQVAPSPPVVGGEWSDVQMEDVSSSSEPKQLREPFYSYITAVGKKQSHASQYVQDAEEVAHLLLTLSGIEIPREGVEHGERRSSLSQFS